MGFRSVECRDRALACSSRCTDAPGRPQPERFTEDFTRECRYAERYAFQILESDVTIDVFE
jgi:hypothetical protein